jgi:spoIIIJ-associated protein
VAPITDEQGREAAAMLLEIISKMGLVATVEYARAEDGAARLNISSEDSALLIGRKGRNLQAMQYIINRIISRTDANDVTERLIVDIEGYVDRRKESLEELAENMAARAKSAGRDMRLKPMSPQERRIVHLALQDDEDVRTFSLGDSLFRTVVISPKERRSGGGGAGSRDSRGGGRGGSRRGGRGRGRGRNEERTTPEADAQGSPVAPGSVEDGAAGSGTQDGGDAYPL